MRVVSGKTLDLVIKTARGAGSSPSVHVGKIGRIGCCGSGKRVVGEETVIVRNVVVEPGFKGRFVKLIFPIENKVVGEPGPCDIWKRKEINDILTYRTD